MVWVTSFKFYIDKYEVTNRDYRKCVAAGTCAALESRSGFDAPNQPVVLVSQREARVYCAWAGKRLPSETEWQEAAQGTDDRRFPWGNAPPNCRLANYYECNKGQTLPVGSKPAGASPCGALDMAGNVWEWVEENGVLRGGGWNRLDNVLLVTGRDHVFGNYRSDDLGFRCVRDGSP